MPAIRFTLPIMDSLEARRLLSAIMPDLGIYTPSNQIQLASGLNNTVIVAHQLGTSGSQAVAADFNGDTLTDTATFLNGTWSIDLSNSGAVDKTVQFGAPGDIAVAGDVFGVGYAALGVYNPSTGVWQFSEHQDGTVNLTIQDAPGGTPVLGDYNGLGHDELLLYKADAWTVRNTDGSLVTTFHLGGAPGDVPVMADLTGNGRDDPGVFNDGTWQFETTHGGPIDDTYSFGAAGDQPLVGYFNPANSIFVAPGGTGNGTLGHPFGTVAQGISAATTGSIIRLAPGNYAENLYMYGKSNVTFFGASMNAVSIDPSTGDALALDRNTDTYVYNMNFAGGDRGLVLMGGSVYVREVSTIGSVNVGVIGTGYLGVDGSIDARHCAFNCVTTGMGVDMQNDCSLLGRNCTIDDNGTNSAIVGNNQYGRGLIVQDNCTVILKYCDLSDNNSFGLNSDGQAFIKIIYSEFNNELGAYVSEQDRVVFRYDTFSNNGAVRDVATGSNGLEIANNYDGPGVTIKFSTFANNGSAGIYIGNGTNLVIADNTFDNNLLGININGVFNSGSGTIAIVADPFITGNLFEVPAGSTGIIVGIYSLGSGAGGTIGGDGSSANTFENYPSTQAIVITDYGYSPVGDYGDPTTTVQANTYINSPDPVKIITTDNY